MRLNFNINYKTYEGETVVLNVADKRFPMATQDCENWHLEIADKKYAYGSVIDYYYSIERDGVMVRHEWLTETHRLAMTAAKATLYNIYNHWKDIPEDSYLYSSAFTDCVNRQPVMTPPSCDYAKTVRLTVRAPQLRQGQRLMLVGKGDVLGNWKPAHAVPMVQHQYNEWICDVDANRLEDGILEFKFLVVSDQPSGQQLWETCSNRVVELPAMSDGDVVVYDLDQAFFEIWNRRMAGTLVPVFSLRSKDSFGVGDFGDLRKMVDWVSATGQRLLQILPINDTTITHTWTDSYPYSCISIFALHPQYVDLTQLPQIADEAKRAEMEALRKELNELPQIDYERVNEAKTRYLRVLFEQEGKQMMATPEYKRFFEDAGQWLIPYAQYSYLRDQYGTADFSKWKDHQTWDENDRKALSNPRTKIYKDVSFYYFIQFILSSQMQTVHRYARAKGVILKGDIPIGVNRYGCDVWMEPEYFNLNGQAGAPPDDFSVNGQNWGFPTYNWQAMLEDDCAWWERRFKNMSKFFDAYRIDHVLGFFRIWEIPADAVHGLLGQFSPALAMTREEIESYGLGWQEELFTTPFITDWVLDRMFGERAALVRERYVEKKDDMYYRMRPEYDTQKKVEAAFADAVSKEETDLRDGLYALISDVLFVRDHRDADKFHPRISVQFDFIFESLYDSDKHNFNKLYNDYFYRRNNDFWYHEAMRKLPKLVQATRMLVCAEDLGMVPDCVPWVMNELRILSLELQSMPKDPSVRFGHLSRNPYRSVCTISSHDMPTLRQWWNEDYERTQEYYNTMLHRGGEAPHPLPGWLARDIVSRHLTSPSMLCVISIQDWLAMDEELRLADQNAERINIPANPKHYWRYRMHLNIEDLMGSNGFNENITDLINSSGRK